MTLDEVKERLREIENESFDDEQAHSLQDKLMTAVLKAIADGCVHPDVIAKEALKVLEIDFKRWFG